MKNVADEIGTLRASIAEFMNEMMRDVTRQLANDIERGKA